MRHAMLLALVVLALAAALPTAADEACSCCPAPDVEQAWTDLSGHRLTLDDLHGRVVVVNFWATWCRPCVEEMPDLVELSDRYGIFGVQVLGAGADAPGDRDAVLEFARALELDFPVVLGATTAQMEALGLPPTLPGTVVLDREGRIVERFAGVFEPRKLAVAVERALGRDEHDHEPEDDGHDHARDDHERHVHIATGAGANEPSLVPS